MWTVTQKLVVGLCANAVGDRGMGEHTQFDDIADGAHDCCQKLAFGLSTVPNKEDRNLLRKPTPTAWMDEES